MEPSVKSFKELGAGDTRHRFWRAQIAGWICLGIAGFFIRLGAFGNAWLAFTLAIVLDPLGFVLTSAGAMLHARYPACGRLRAVSIAALLCLAASLVCAAIAHGIHGFFPADAVTYIPRNGFSLGWFYYLAVYSIWALVYFGISIELDARAERMLKMRAQTQALQLKLDHLQLQIEPHFLFNTLNTIVAEIQDRPAIAEEMTRRLASYLRYSLNRRSSAICRLEEEIAALETYIGIQALRFGDRFSYRCDVDPASLQAGIPHMALQGLAENAIKHGMQAEHAQFSINLRAWMKDDALVVEMDNPGTLGASLDSTSEHVDGVQSQDLNGVPGANATNDLAGANGVGVGLTNLSQRLALHYPGRSRFSLEQRADRTVATIYMEGAPCFP